MKTYNKPATSKLLSRFDNELKNILMADLKALKEKGQFTSNHQSAQKKAA
ncbi:MAG TPA: hypothetical protein VL490_04235 [Mucilaginibacter sp.]|jgi:hypothetical protein|nr:hypothetical protein [Mucilaginibacter sp.]